MTDLEFVRWTTKVAADATLAATLVGAPSCMRFPPMPVGDIHSASSVDLSWVTSVAALDPSSFRELEYWKDRPACESLKTQTSVAIHEAAHMVCNEQFLEAGTNVAVAISMGGCSGMSWHPTTRYRPDLIGLLDKTLMVTAGNYAGRLAELMAAGRRWTMPVMDFDQDDFRHSHAVLTKIEDQPLLAMMASSQQLALRVLHQCWPRVIEIAEQLMTHSSYAAEIQAENQINPSALLGSGAGGTAGEVGG